MIGFRIVDTNGKNVLRILPREPEKLKQDYLCKMHMCMYGKDGMKIYRAAPNIKTQEYNYVISLLMNNLLTNEKHIMSFKSVNNEEITIEIIPHDENNIHVIVSSKDIQEERDGVIKFEI